MITVIILNFFFFLFYIFFIFLKLLLLLLVLTRRSRIIDGTRKYRLVCRVSSLSCDCLFSAVASESLEIRQNIRTFFNYVKTYICKYVAHRMFEKYCNIVKKINGIERQPISRVCVFAAASLHFNDTVK